MSLVPHSYGNGPEVRLNDDGTLDEVCTPTAHLEQLDTGHWFLEVEVGGKAVAVWLNAKGKITATYERRENAAPQAVTSTGSPLARIEPLAVAAPSGPVEKTYDLQDMETFCALAASRMYEACLQAVEDEQLSGETGHPEDEIYMRAVNDCIGAIKRLPLGDSTDATSQISTGD